MASKKGSGRRNQPLVDQRKTEKAPQTSTTIRERATQQPVRKAAPPPQPSGNLAFAMIGLVVLLAIGGLVGILLFGSNRNSGEPAAAPAAAASVVAGDIPVGVDPDAQVRSFALLNSPHLQGNQQVRDLLPSGYNSDPPTSGPHQAGAAPWGLYNEQVRDDLLVHNLEHGGIVIHYNCSQGCPTAVNTLSAYARRYPQQSFTGIILAPRPLPNGARISLSAWGNLLLLDTLDVEKINSFITQYINKGPEKDPSFRP
jgi:Protein of unknown function (DUF3105)